MPTNDRLSAPDRHAVADKAFQDYEFGAGVDVTDSGGWESVSSMAGPEEMTRKVYVETEPEDDSSPSERLTFTVRFSKRDGSLEEAYAIDRKGQIWGSMPMVREVEPRIIAGFQPQAWVNKRAIDIDGQQDVDVTNVVLDMSLADIRALEDCRESTDRLVNTDALGHAGPYAVRATDSVCQYFNVDELSEVTEVMLLAARKTNDAIKERDASVVASAVDRISTDLNGFVGVKNPALETLRLDMAKQLDSYQIAAILRGRGLAVAVWNTNDVISIIEADADTCDLDQGDQGSIAENFLLQIRQDFEASLNDQFSAYAADRWTELKADLVSEIVDTDSSAERPN